MLQCMNHLHSTGLLPIEDLWRVGGTNPLALLGDEADAKVRRRAAEMGPLVRFVPERGFEKNE